MSRGLQGERRKREIKKTELIEESSVREWRASERASEQEKRVVVVELPSMNENENEKKKA